ncbi:PREDICTED: pescadillo homolog [Wasmannia auropunctata]|uniref:pescadillo homolog n=1 Tax=Wasmannia auropunctata TaxID=64793 RepID=UPI0005EF8EBE|nr:PREDICTED: pescadillo homolog [Wasmannia auropunctata]
MLIVNIILFTSAICSATIVVTSTGASVTSATSTKSKRVVVDPGHNIRNNQEQSRGTQTTPRIPSPQDINSRSSPRYGNAKAPDTQRAPYISSANHGPGTYAYGSVPKRPLSTPVIRQIESHRSNLLAPYFGILNNPDAYKAARSVEKPLERDVSKSIVSQSLQKLQGIYSPGYNAFHQNKPIELSSFSDFEYPSFGSIGKLIPQGVSSPTVQAPVYKSMSYPLSKLTDFSHVYAPSIPTVSGVAPPFSEKTRQKDEAIVDVNGKKISVPVIQLTSNLDFSEVLPAFESQPFLSSLSANYPIESDVGFKFGSGSKVNMALQSSNVSPFSSPLSSFQGQVVPIQTANGSPQFPQYKGASIQAYPIASNIPKAQGNYESLYNQPHLHFDKVHNGNMQPVNAGQNNIHPSVSTQDILNDVELINKKNPEPHTPQPDDDDDDEDDREDKRYKNPDKEYSSEEDDVERRPGKSFKASPTESDFKPSPSYPFKEYDERFGKLLVRAQHDNDDDDFEDKPSSSYKNYPSDDDEEEEDSSSEDRAEYIESSKPSRDSYEEEDDEEEEEESRKQEKRKKVNEGFREAPKRSKYYQKDFEQEFEEGYKEELPKQEYVHVKEVPEIDSNNNPSPASKRQQKHSNQSRVKHGQSKESKSQESRNSRKNYKVPKTDYRDSTAYGSDISAKTSPKVIYEEFFGYKKPETGKYSKHAKTGKSLTKKSPKEDGHHLRAAKYYKFKNLKTGSDVSSEDKKDPHPLSIASNTWKLNKNSPEKKVIPRSNVRQLSDPDDGASFYGPSIESGRARSITNEEIFRDLTGI